MLCGRKNRVEMSSSATLPALPSTLAAHLSMLWACLAPIEVLLHLRLIETDAGTVPRTHGLAGDLTLLALALLPPALALTFTGRRGAEAGSRPRRLAWRAAGALPLWLLLLTVAAHWATYSVTGSFLSWEGFLFWVRQPVQVFHWIDLELTLWALAGTLALALLLAELVPKLPRKAGPAAWLAPGVALTLTAAWFGFGEARTHSTRPGHDADSYAANRAVKDYRIARDLHSGPFGFSLSGWRSRGPSLRLPADPSLPLERPRQVTLDEYAARVDPQRLRRHNVILIVVESLRADQLFAYGARRDVMPEVNRLARQSRVFLEHYAQASHSNYADPAIVSSQYPLRSRTAHSYPEFPDYPRVLVYDVLKKLGYRTALFSSQNENWGRMINFLDTGNLDRIFHAENFPGETYVMLGDFGFSSWVSRTRHAGSIDDRHTVDAARDWIAELDADTPFFLSMNLQNSHVPYRVPEDFPRPFGPDSIDFAIHFGVFPRDRARIVRDRYADSLAYIDLQLSRLFQFLRESGRWDETIVALTGDTGQAFYEHGFAAHANQLYNEVMKVPLLLRAPGLEAGTDGLPAQQVDVAPSILSLLGLPPHEAFQGTSLVEPRSPGRSLYVVVQTPLAYQHAIVRSGYKLIYDERRDRYQLYDQARDPAEENDLAAAEPDRVRRLAGRLHRWYDEQLRYYADRERKASEYAPVLPDQPTAAETAAQRHGEAGSRAGRRP